MGGGNPLRQKLSDFFHGKSGASFRVADTLVYSSEGLLIFFVQNSQSLQIGYFALGHTLTVA